MMLRGRAPVAPPMAENMSRDKRLAPMGGTMGMGG